MNLRKLLASTGTFRGEGINHEGQKFTGTLELRELFGGTGAQLSFEARDSSTIFHSELSTIAPNLTGGYSLFNFNTNIPFLAEHVLVKEEGSFIFRFGDIANTNSFREEVHLELLPDSIRYTYFWGMPGGDFKERSSAFMNRCN